MKLPWYSFLYRLLGAQGTFWLWLIVVLTLWWTTKPALIRLVNRTPQAVGLERAREPSPTTRWVSVAGVEVKIDRRLVHWKDKDGAELSPTLPPLPILLDPTKQPGAWWVETRAQADLHAGLPATGAFGGGVGALGVSSQRDLIKRFARLEGNVEDFLPPPEQSLLVQYEDADFSLAADPPKPKVEETSAERYRRVLAERIERVRSRVRYAAVEGVLDPMPKVVGERLVDELGVKPAPYLIQVGVKPSELETRVFAIAAVLFVFLGAGLYGATRAPASEDESPAAPAPEPGTPEPSAPEPSSE